MFLFSTLIIIIGFLYDAIHGADRPCNCSSYGGCVTTNRCLPDDQECKKENVALNKMAAMSSVFVNSQQTEWSGYACLAVNGNRSHTLVFIKKQTSSTFGINCIHTNEFGYNPWWSVDLGAKFTITDVTIYNRNSFQNRLNGVKVSVDEQLCDTTKDIDTDLLVYVTCNNPVRGQTVKLQITRNKKDILNFCEVEVWVCSAGRYGPTCDELCTGNCKNNETCDNYNGTCWDGCKEGFYGSICNQTCGNCKDIACDQMTGRCLSGCQAGWQGPLCDVSCDPGTFGLGCREHCGECKMSCNRVSGQCDGGCVAGYTSLYCNATCSNTTYGENCAQTCGYCADSEPCNITSGHCRECQEGHDLPFGKSQRQKTCQRRVCRRI